MIGVSLSLTSLRKSGPSVQPNTVKVVTEGDSITNGLGATGGQPGWPGKAVPTLMTDLTKTYTLANIGTSGYTIGNMDANFATRSGARYDPTKELNVLTIMGGTNDGAVTDQFDVYRDLRRIVQKARNAGYNRVLVCTLISRSDGAGPANANGYFNGSDLPYNQDIRNYWSSDLDADGIIDFGLNEFFDTVTDADSTTYYTDKLHPKNAGYDIMAQVAGAAISDVVATPGMRTTAPAIFSPYDTSNYLIASNGGRTVAWAAPGFSDAQARSFIGKETGKWYWEMVQDTYQFTAIGVTNFDYFYTYFGNRGLNNNDKSIGTKRDDANGGLFMNNIAITTQPKLANGDVTQWALDRDNQLLWMREVGQNWNGNALADPATGVGGVDISSLGSGKYYPAAYIRADGGVVTSRFALADMTEAIPSGFTALDQ